MPVWNKTSPGHRRKTRRWPDLHPLGVGECDGPHRRDPRPWRSRPGSAFTLLEVVLVLAIVAVLAAVAAPRYGCASARYRADLAARRIAADLCLAQSCARTASSSRTVSFFTQTESYQLRNIPSTDGLTGDYTVFLSAEPYKADLVSADFSGSAQVVFNGWGLPTNGGTVIVAAGSEQRKVVIDGETGGISIQ